MHHEEMPHEFQYACWFAIFRTILPKSCNVKWWKHESPYHYSGWEKNSSGSLGETALSMQAERRRAIRKWGHNDWWWVSFLDHLDTLTTLGWLCPDQCIEEGIPLTLGEDRTAPLITEVHLFYVSFHTPIFKFSLNSSCSPAPFTTLFSFRPCKRSILQTISRAWQSYIMHIGDPTTGSGPPGYFQWPRSLIYLQQDGSKSTLASKGNVILPPKSHTSTPMAPPSPNSSNSRHYQFLASCICFCWWEVKWHGIRFSGDDSTIYCHSKMLLDFSNFNPVTWITYTIWQFILPWSIQASKPCTLF